MSRVQSDACSGLLAGAGPATPDRLCTGIEGLDRLLGGGLIRGNSLLIEGPPGSGKSTLAVRIVHEGIVHHREPALIIAFEEFPRQIYREALASGVDLQAHERAGMLRVLWTPPSRVLEGFRGHGDLVTSIIEELGVRRVVIDSITHFKRVASSESELRELLSAVLCDLKLKNVSSFLVKETESAEGDDIAFEEYLVDASLRVYHDAAVTCPSGGARTLELRKTRGQDHRSGRHPFELGSDGVNVHPRLTTGDIDSALGTSPAISRRRTSIGDPGLDRMMDGGPWSGSLQLLVGPTGAGKSLLAQQFVDVGLRSAESAVFVTLRDEPSELLARASGFGLVWSDALAAGRLRFLHADPTRWPLERVQNRLLHLVASAPTQRLVFDGIDDLRPTLDGAGGVRELLLLLSHLARSTGATIVTTLEEPDGDLERAAELREAARASDGVIELRVSVDATGLDRSVLVSKHSRSAHALDARRYVIGRHGLRLEDSASTPAQSPSGRGEADRQA